MIVFEGDFIKCFNRPGYFEVVEIIDSMRVRLSNNRIVPTDWAYGVIEDLKSADEYNEEKLS